MNITWKSSPVLKEQKVVVVFVNGGQIFSLSKEERILMTYFEWNEA